MAKEPRGYTGVRKRLFGEQVVLNAHTKKGYRVSPGVNSHARDMQKCMTGKTTEGRKQCMRDTKKGVKRARPKRE